MSFSPVHEPPHRQNHKEGDIGGNDGSGKVGVSHDLPQYQPCEDAHVEQIRKEIEVNLTHTHQAAKCRVAALNGGCRERPHKVEQTLLQPRVPLCIV